MHKKKFRSLNYSRERFTYINDHFRRNPLDAVLAAPLFLRYSHRRFLFIFLNEKFFRNKGSLL